MLGFQESRLGNKVFIVRGSIGQVKYFSIMKHPVPFNLYVHTSYPTSHKNIWSLKFENFCFLSKFVVHCMYLYCKFPRNTSKLSLRNSLVNSYDGHILNL